jgi:hypothetical protein
MKIRLFLLLLVMVTAAWTVGCELIGTEAEPDHVYIYSVTASPTDSEQITLKNPTDASVDLTDWTLGDLNNPTAYIIPNGTIISAGGSKTYPRTTLGFQINDSGETIYLKDALGSTVDTWSN